MLFLFRDGSGEMPKPKSFVSIYGERVTYSDERIAWVTGRPTTYSVVVPVSTASDNEQRIKQADELFTYYAGSYANDLGFTRVLIRPDDGSRPGEVNILGFRFSFRASVGTGSLTDQDLEDGIVYEKQPDGVWSRGSFKPDAPFHVQNIILPADAKFALTYSMTDYPAGWFVYECMSCRPQGANQVVAASLYPLLQSATKLADRDHLMKASVAIFMEPRKSTWQFPTVLHINIARRNGHWIAPKLSEQEVKTLFAEYVRRMKLRGVALRREKL
jgi:hypothetical protein